LIAAGGGDQFAAAVLPLPKLRYVFFDAEDGYCRYGLDFRSLGIAVTAGEAIQLPKLEPAFRRRLKDWGVDSAEPVATVILARGGAELPRVAQAFPDADFFLPEDLAPLLESTHLAWRTHAGRAILLRREPARQPAEKGPDR
jgi:hypothetical protein